MSSSGMAGSRASESCGGAGGHLTRALIGGIVAGVPVAWLLAYLSVLPYFLGLFFFLVLGLLVGAVMYRLGRGAAPVTRERLTPISLIVALVVWCTVLMMEYRWFPDLAAKQGETLSVTSGMNPAQLEEYHDTVRQAAREGLRKLAWPGSFPGYIRWASTTGRMSLPRAGDYPPFEFKNVQLPLAWAIRVTLSLVLLIFAIDSQFSSLAPKKVLDEEESPAGDSETK